MHWIDPLTEDVVRTLQVQYGFGTLADLARATGISRSRFYEHFTGQRALSARMRQRLAVVFHRPQDRKLLYKKARTPADVRATKGTP